MNANNLSVISNSSSVHSGNTGNNASSNHSNISNSDAFLLDRFTDELNVVADTILASSDNPIHIQHVRDVIAAILDIIAKFSTVQRTAMNAAIAWLNREDVVAAVRADSDSYKDELAEWYKTILLEAFDDQLTRVSDAILASSNDQRRRLHRAYEAIHIKLETLVSGGGAAAVDLSDTLEPLSDVQREAVNDMIAWLDIPDVIDDVMDRWGSYRDAFEEWRSRVVDDTSNNVPLQEPHPQPSQGGGRRRPNRKSRKNKKHIPRRGKIPRRAITRKAKARRARKSRRAGARK